VLYGFYFLALRDIVLLRYRVVWCGFISRELLALLHSASLSWSL